MSYVTLSFRHSGVLLAGIHNGLWSYSWIPDNDIWESTELFISTTWPARWPQCLEMTLLPYLCNNVNALKNSLYNHFKKVSGKN